jgi:hypothetical protein
MRALALLITCVLGLTLITGARSSLTHNQVSHRAAVLAVSSADALHVLHRPDQSATLPPAAAAGSGGAVSTGFANSSTSVSSRTAHTPQVRGPPAQALA